MTIPIMDEPNKNISSEELELTEGELERIFFGSEESVKEEVPSDISDNDFKEDHITKNIEKKTIKIKNILPSKPEKLERKNIEKKKDKEESIKPESESEDPEKRPRGRPKKWTDEKLLQLKEENKRKAKLRRQQRLEQDRIAQLTGDHPITEYEKKKRITEVIKTKEDIEKHISEKRTTLKAAIDRKYVTTLDSKTKCKDHLYKISHEETTTRDPIAICVHCSKVKHFTPADWRLYLIRNRSRL